MTGGSTARPFSTIEDIREWITESTPPDWEVGPVPARPRFRLGSLLLEQPGPPPHEWRAVYLPHQQLRLLWGRERGRPYEPDWQPARWGPAQPKLAEVFWKGLIEVAGHLARAIPLCGGGLRALLPAGPQARRCEDR